MNAAAARFLPRLLALHVAVHVVTFLVAGAFAPQTLLLGAATGGAWLVILFIAALVLLSTVVVTVVLARPAGPLLRALAVGSAAAEPEHLVLLNALPARLSIAGVAATLVASALSTLLPFHPRLMLEGRGDRAVGTYVPTGLSVSGPEGRVPFG